MDNAALRNFKDFLQQYNKITETCFSHCINTLSERNITPEELQCIDGCAFKHIRVNHKVMSVYMEVQPIIMNRRLEEMNQAQASITASLDINTNMSTVDKQSQQPIETTQQQPISAQS